MSQVTLLIMTAGVLVLGMPCGSASHAKLVFNASASEPRGWYWIARSERPKRGEIVLAHLPEPAARLADQRGYLPRGVPILKRVGAIGRQRICVKFDQVWIDERPVARALARDGAGRPLINWNDCRLLSQNELFLLNPSVAASFDSRYFGPIGIADVIGRAEPILTW